jgi:hypothetical protein
VVFTASLFVLSSPSRARISRPTTRRRWRSLSPIGVAAVAAASAVTAAAPVAEAAAAAPGAAAAAALLAPSLAVDGAAVGRNQLVSPVASR